MNKAELKHLNTWIENLKYSQVKMVIAQCVDELIRAEMIDYHPEDDEFQQYHSGPYWCHNGDGIEGTNE